jgi:hypothetical protein
LERGRFKWPAANENETTMLLTNDELSHLLGSPKVIQKLMRKEVRIGSAV